ncbi:hypothetical protein Taro_026020 [Colocasia esculenta]|uniref:F-box domain-containing protein n=1 Tax=Colocasia esculenta TaxID=4460 RepID=A0A843VFX1_COLES|nr:hypothetical protein [Colocasia esculenta]
MDHQGSGSSLRCSHRSPSSPWASDLPGSWAVAMDEEVVVVMEERGSEVEVEEEGVDQFDRLPDSVLLLVFNRIGDVKALGRCCAVSRRFHSLVPLVDNVLVRVDCVISDDDHHANTAPGSPSSPSSSSSSASSSSCSAGGGKARGGLFSHLARLVLGGIVRPLQAIGQILASPSSGAGTFAGRLSSASSSASTSPSAASSVPSLGHSEVSHHSPTEVLRNFREIRRLRIELPAGELGVEDGVLLKWKAGFGSTLESCVILGANSVLPSSVTEPSFLASEKDAADANNMDDNTGGGADDNGSIPESFYTNGSLKLRVVWTISSLIAASARHFLLQPIIADHVTLENLDLTDADGQGVLRMDRGQLEDLRVKPVSVSSSSQRTLVPALNMRLWYAQHLELPGGVVLKGATLVAIRPSESSRELPPVAAADAFGGGHQDTSWVANAFEEPYGSAVRQLVKRRTFCLEMNSF